MSREQWGHGYWQGVRDACDGVVKDGDNVPLIANYVVAMMCCSKYESHYSRSLFSVKELCAVAMFSGFDLDIIERVYKHILHDQPIGCYVTGSPKNEWTEDYFVLPIERYDKNTWHEVKQFCLDELEEYYSANKERNKA